MREGYDARAWGFCTERLGSYLVLRRLRALGPAKPRFLSFRHSMPTLGPSRFFGRLNLITEDTVDYVIGS